MNPFVLDTEVTGAQRNKGNPFDPRNRLCAVSTHFKGSTSVYNIEHGPDPYADKIKRLQEFLDGSDILVGFNLKFDVHWCRRYGLSFNGKRIWDCQLYHFIWSNQKHRLPSLNDVCGHYGLPVKLNVVSTEYWDKGLDTDVVPWEILEEYAAYDAELTYRVFLKQYEEFIGLDMARRNLILLHMADLLVLEEMEYNGFKYDVEQSLEMGGKLEYEISAIDQKLATYCPTLPISFNSDRQLSAFLFGGSVVREEPETYTYTYKDGRTAQKQRKIKKEYILPRIFAPDPRTEKDKPGVFAVDVAALKTLRYKSTGFRNTILDLLLKRSKLEKKKSTYCFGTPALLGEMAWEDGLLHPQLNQCVVVTGRLSSSKPNLQNQEADMQRCFVSRFPINDNKC